MITSYQVLNVAYKTVLFFEHFIKMEPFRKDYFRMHISKFRWHFCRTSCSIIICTIPSSWLKYAPLFWRNLSKCRFYYILTINHFFGSMVMSHDRFLQRTSIFLNVINQILGCSLIQEEFYSPFEVPFLYSEGNLPLTCVLGFLSGLESF